MQVTTTCQLAHECTLRYALLYQSYEHRSDSMSTCSVITAQRTRLCESHGVVWWMVVMAAVAVCTPRRG